MPSMTYTDIIDDKVAEWQAGLTKLEGQIENATSDTRDKLLVKLEALKVAIDAAIAQLRDLDAQETVANTLETKDKILGVFSSIDKDFAGFEGSSPFML